MSRTDADGWVAGGATVGARETEEDGGEEPRTLKCKQPGKIVRYDVGGGRSHIDVPAPETIPIPTGADPVHEFTLLLQPVSYPRRLTILLFAIGTIDFPADAKVIGTIPGYVVCERCELDSEPRSGVLGVPTIGG